MKFILLCFITFSSIAANPWGFMAHKEINFYAIFLLPPELFGFYKQHAQYIKQSATKPDQRRYIVNGEDVKHYIDLDHYEKSVPLDTIRLPWTEACNRFNEDSLRTYGILPWNTYWVYLNLIEAFTELNVDRILSLSADLGHYLADAHVPLHTTENYNGQLTNQHGIHGLWESRLPELYFKEYDLFMDKAQYISSPQLKIWNIIETSNSQKDSVLHLERSISLQHATDKFSYVERKQRTIKTYSEAFCRDYHLAMKNMVERQLRSSVFDIACMWYSAWIMAGQPDLNEKTLNKRVDLQEQVDSGFIDSVFLKSNRPRIH